MKLDNFKLSSMTSSGISEPPHSVRPEFILTIALDQDLKDLGLDLKLNSLRNFMNNFDFPMFLSTLENDIDTLNNLQKFNKNIDKGVLLELYLMTNNNVENLSAEQQEMVTSVREELLEHLDNVKKTSKQKKAPRPSLTPSTSGDEVKPKKKEEYKYNPPKLVRH